MSFTHADVQNIIQLLDSSHFDELVLEMDGIKLELRRGGGGGGGEHAITPAAAPKAARASTPSAATPPSDSARSAAPAAAVAQPASSGAGLQDIRAPMLGTFYSAPKPGAAPFVSVGDRVEADTVVGIIEVMKLMNSTSAGVSGEIVEILVKDGDLVEYEQTLMRVKA